MHNEFQLIIKDLPLCQRPSPKHFEKGELVECIKAQGQSWEFHLKAAQKYRVADCQKGGISIHGHDANKYFDARRFKKVEGEKPFLGVANPYGFQKFGKVAA